MLTTTIILLLALSLLTGNLLAVTIAMVGFAILYFEFAGNFSVIGPAIWNIFNSFTLSAVPVFILLGEVLSHTGMAQRIYSAVSPTFERLPGKLLQTNIGTCTVFSAISGSSMATAAAVGSIAFNELERRGYNRRAIVGSIAGGGTLGMMIPPSIVMIIYGAWTEVSIGSLFIAGIVPGLMISMFFMLYIGIHAKLKPTLVPTEERRVPMVQALRLSVQAWPFVILIFTIMGTIFLGLATPTESAALGVTTVLVLALLYGELTVGRMWNALRGTVITFSSLMLIIVAGVILSQAVALTGLPQRLVLLVGESGLPPFVILTLIYSMYLLLGMVLDGFGMLLITLPFVFPLVTEMGYDPIWFGIVVVMVIEISLLTPPLGFNLFVLMAMSKGRVSLGEAAIACLPFWLLLIAAIILITVAPHIVLFLPDLVMSG